MSRNKVEKPKLSQIWRDRLWLGSWLLISSAVMFSFMAKSSIWHDEGYSMLLSSQPVEQIIERTARDVHPPLYYILLHGWTGIFGNSEIAARSLSAVVILAAMAIMFLIVRRLFGSGTARVAILFMALSPFLIRYGQEARMYGLVAMLITLATYLLITALEDKSYSRLYLYALIMAASFYTHYYTIFMVIVHWIYVTWRTKWRQPRQSRTLDLKNWQWWAANALIVLLFLPWVPIAYGQFSRVQGGFWIGDVGLYTLPSTLAQWLHFTSFATLPNWLRLGIPAVLVVAIGSAFYREPANRLKLGLLALWALLAPLAVFLVSVISRPIYIDRYFGFAAVAFYALVAALLFSHPLNKLSKIRPLLVVALVLVLVSGINNVYRQSNHRMGDIGRIVTERATTGDRIIAGELYVYLDFSYYNHSGRPLYLYAPAGISGYGETSLIYDRPELVINDYEQLGRTADSVWVVGKAGDKDYFKAIPSSWSLIESYQSGESVVRRYQTISGLLARP